MGIHQRIRVGFSPQPGPQEAFIQAPHDIVAYGGSRGGGKTYASLGEFWLHAERYGIDARGLMLRKTREDLKETRAVAEAMYADAAEYSEKGNFFRFRGGARLYMAYLENDHDAEHYQGWSLTRLYVEEVTQFSSSTPIMRLLATLRSAKKIRCQMRLTCNPGGPGHHWVKSMFIDNGAYNSIVDADTGITRVFIPAKLLDNPALLMNDPRYVDRLRSVGSPELVRAWLEGDWNVIEGAFFPEFTEARHIIQPFTVPKHWTRFRAMDWGSAKPYAVLWFSVVQDDYPIGNGRVLPRGALVAYRELYGASAPNVGVKLPAEKVAGLIKASEAEGEEIDYGVLDPAAFAVISGPSIGETLGINGVYFRRADNTRLSIPKRMGGFDQIRQRLQGDGDGRPMLYVFSTCRDLIRTLPMMQHDDVNPEDMDTDGEDHLPDALRYGCMSRPYIQTIEKPDDLNPFRADNVFRRDVN